MSRVQLSIAMGDYDRTRALLDGTVRIDGVDPIFMALSPDEIFFRAFRNQEFDVSELSLSSYLVKLSNGNCPYIGVPIFLSRAFRHTSIYVRTDRIKQPTDLRGKRIGVPEYQLTAIVWARSILQDDYGVNPEEVIWVRGGITTAGRAEKISIQLPPGIRLEASPPGETISDMLDRGDIDGFIAPRPPHNGERSPAANVGWLFSDPTAAAKAYFQRTGVFPIMHVVGVKTEIAAKHPWLPGALLKAFNDAKNLALTRLSDTSATKVTLPFVEEQLQSARSLMGEDYWSYGVEANKATLNAFLRIHHAQGLSNRLLTIDELFHPASYETFRI